MNADSTLRLGPIGRAVITFSTLSIDDASSGFYAPSDYLELNEVERDEVFYSGGAGIDGGEYISHHGPLVEVTFRVFIRGNTKAQCITRAQTLNKAVNNNEGGTLEYKPDGISARSTYYTYVKSFIPGLARVQDNKWDNPNVSAPSSEPYILAFDVALQTMPIGTSDPGNLVSLTLSRTTIRNTRDGAFYNYFDIDGSDIKGDKPAFIRLMLRNGQTGAFEKINIMYVTARSALLSTLANLKQVYEAEDASVISPSTAWSSIVDADRSAGDYRRCNPGAGANGVAQGIRFAISNADDHMGRVAILAVCRTASPEDWSVQAKYRLTDDEVFAAESYDVLQYGVWHVVYCGELDLPPVPTSNTETIAPYIDLFFTRSAGGTGDHIDVDYILLFFMNETLMQFVVDVGYDNSQKLLSEGTPENRSVAHIIDQSSHVLENVVDKHYGDKCLRALPGFDTRVALLFQRVGGITTGGAGGAAGANVAMDDDFDSYEALYWLPVADLETDESWFSYGPYPSTGDTTYYVEGDQSRRLNFSASGGSTDRNVSLDLNEDGRFTDGDYVCAVFYISSGDIGDLGSSQLSFFDGSDQYAAIFHNLGDSPLIVAGYNFVAIKKSDLWQGGSPDWSEIDNIRLIVGASASGSGYLYLDAWTIVKADPGDAAVPNPTGAEWDFQPAGYHWAITNNSPSGSSNAVLACYDQEAGVEKTAVYDTTMPDDVRGFLKVAANKDAGEAGIALRVNDQSLGSEDLYAFVVDWDNDQLEALEYIAGAKNNLDTAAQAVTDDTWYWLGFLVIGTVIKLYFSATEPAGTTRSEQLENLLSSPNKVFSVSDATLTSGKIGVISTGCLSMFDELYVESLESLSAPGDFVTAQAEALFRTSYPFAD